MVRPAAPPVLPPPAQSRLLPQGKAKLQPLRTEFSLLARQTTPMPRWDFTIGRPRIAEHLRRGLPSSAARQSRAFIVSLVTTPTRALLSLPILTSLRKTIP